MRYNAVTPDQKEYYVRIGLGERGTDYNSGFLAIFSGIENTLIRIGASYESAASYWNGNKRSVAITDLAIEGLKQQSSADFRNFSDNYPLLAVPANIFASMSGFSAFPSQIILLCFGAGLFVFYVC